MDSSSSEDGGAADALAELVATGEGRAARERLAELESAAVDDRKAATRRIRSIVAERPADVEPVAPALAPYLTDQERSIRLTTAKALVALAEAAPDAVVPLVSPLADRLADDEEFYYVRARAAEALGYVARENPAAVASPDVLADLTVGLSLEQAEVREKLAKAVESIAIGNPARLRHQVADLAAHLDGDNDLVRYHVATALAVVACEFPERVVDVRDGLRGRLDDESPFVRGRAVEALGILAVVGGSTAVVSVDELDDTLDTGDGDDEQFLADRVAFARAALADAEATAGDSASIEDVSESVGTLAGIRESTDDAVAAIVRHDHDGECPRCGLGLPETGPPLCPRCGAPH